MNLSNKIFFNKKILIYGMGKTGSSSYNFLKKKNKIYLYDDDEKIVKRKFNKSFLNIKRTNMHLLNKYITAHYTSC